MDIEGNHRIWNDLQHWETGYLGNGVPLADGEKWSADWGHSRFQWASTILPRIGAYLPAGHVVEIGCGRGRWSQYLKDACHRLTLLDLSETLVAFCADRFRDDPQVACRLTDGLSLPGVADRSVDLVFSFDSLVHADQTVLDAYLAEIGRVLVPGGAAFLHHSNLGGAERRQVKDTAMRDPTSSAERVAQSALRAGLAPMVQELVPWTAANLAADQFIDCFTTLRSGLPEGLPEGTPEWQGRLWQNRLFEAEKAVARGLCAIYGPGTGRPGTEGPGTGGQAG
jgi:ubiquinone/menaquinone biosynthesis C-methylase UbiE